MVFLYDSSNTAYVLFHFNSIPPILLLPYHTTMQSSSAAAIDFARLRRQERQKARQQRRRTTTTATTTQEQQHQLPPSLATTTKNENATDTTTTTSTRNDSYPPWYRDALTCQDVQVLQFPQHVLCHNPPSLYYIPQYFKKQEQEQSGDDANDSDYAQALIAWLQGLPENTTHHGGDNNSLTAYRQAHGKWTRLPHAGRRVALFDASLRNSTNNNDDDKDDDKAAGFPPPLAGLVEVLHETVWKSVIQHHHKDNNKDKEECIRINHILINEYTATQGILSHTDGPAYYPCTITLSLASDAVLEFTTSSSSAAAHQQQRRCDQVWLAAQSLVVFTDAWYRDYQHAIPESQRTTSLGPRPPANDGPPSHCTTPTDMSSAAAAASSAATTTTTSSSSTYCWNGTPGQTVTRGPVRYSLTFRCKKPV